MNLNMFSGYRTMAFGALVAVAPSLVAYLTSVDVGVSPAAGLVLGGVIMALRVVTTTPVTVAKDAAPPKA